MHTFSHTVPGMHILAHKVLDMRTLTHKVPNMHTLTLLAVDNTQMGSVFRPSCFYHKLSYPLSISPAPSFMFTIFLILWHLSLSVLLFDLAGPSGS